MKYLSSLFFVLCYLTTSAQVPSNCSVPEALRTFYDQDVKGLAMKRMQAQNSPDNALIEIPASVQDSIFEGLAAILNVMNELPQADSAFNLYCVHDVVNSPAVFGMIIGVDTNSPIAAAWQAGNTLTGNEILDTLLAQHNFSLQSYFSFGAGVLYSDQIWNIFALADSISNSVPGIEYVEPDLLIGGAGQIGYNTDDNGDRFYEFRYEWNDCFDGCDNFYTWRFSVTPDCDVTFLGSDEGGVFGTQPLPDPVNCMLFTNTENVIPEHALQLYPNPGTDWFSWKNAPLEGSWQLYNSTGQLVRSGNWSQDQVDTPNLASGVYWLKLINPQGQFLGQKSWIKN
ncbi:MAG: T9SS type A sorting domain-containing protein [Bacteroidota bacterium]